MYFYGLQHGHFIGGIKYFSLNMMRYCINVHSWNTNFPNVVLTSIKSPELCTVKSRNCSQDIVALHYQVIDLVVVLIALEWAVTQGEEKNQTLLFSWIDSPMSIDVTLRPCNREESAALGMSRFRKMYFKSVHYKITNILWRNYKNTWDSTILATPTQWSGSTGS